MNKTGIEWCTHCQNIMTGCKNRELGICNVDACYARQIAENPFYRKAFPYGFNPHFYPERLNQVRKLRRPAIIFMDSMSDTFGSWWTDEQILKVLDVICQNPQHRFVILTKNPERIDDFIIEYSNSAMNHCYFGTSVTGKGDIEENSRIYWLKKCHNRGFKTVLSMEPLLYDPVPFLTYNINWLDWIIIGGQTKPTKIPLVEWLLEIGSRPFPVFVKENAGLTNLDKSKMFPADLLPIAQAWGKI